MAMIERTSENGDQVARDQHTARVFTGALLRDSSNEHAKGRIAPLYDAHTAQRVLTAIGVRGVATMSVLLKATLDDKEPTPEPDATVADLYERMLLSYPLSDAVYVLNSVAMCRDDQFQGKSRGGRRLFEMLWQFGQRSVYAQVALDRADPDGAAFDVVGEFMAGEREHRSVRPTWWEGVIRDLDWVMPVIEANKKHQTKLPSVLDASLAETKIIAPLRDIILKHLLPARCFAAAAAAPPSPPTPSS